MAEDLFDLLNNDPQYINTQVTVSFFEIYGGRCQVCIYIHINICVNIDFYIYIYLCIHMSVFLYIH
jgi:hypothetical protein